MLVYWNIFLRVCVCQMSHFTWFPGWWWFWLTVLLCWDKKPLALWSLLNVESIMSVLFGLAELFNDRCRSEQFARSCNAPETKHGHELSPGSHTLTAISLQRAEDQPLLIEVHQNISIYQRWCTVCRTCYLMYLLFNCSLKCQFSKILEKHPHLPSMASIYTQSFGFICPAFEILDTI